MILSDMVQKFQKLLCSLIKNKAVLQVPSIIQKYDLYFFSSVL